MRDNGQKCFVQAYNVPIAVDAHAQVIVAAELAQQSLIFAFMPSSENEMNPRSIHYQPLFSQSTSPV